jgi:hypothetical protein
MNSTTTGTLNSFISALALAKASRNSFGLLTRIA